MADMIALHGGQILGGVHPAETCLLEHCCIHGPSDHPLNTAPLEWVGGIGMFRMCKHEILHPDPDDIAFKMATGQWMTVEAITSVHLVEENCDGCCHG